MNTEILQSYQGLAKLYQTNINSKQKQLKLISLGSVHLFYWYYFPTYYCLNQFNGVLALSVSLLLLVSFFVLIKNFIQTNRKLLIFQGLVEINKDETKAINRDLSPFDSGSEFIDTHHNYSYDLDLYGTGSLFQFLNRTITNRGKKQLSSILNGSQHTSETIIERQLAIQELAGDLN
jgi:hypothetical protein